MKYLLLITLALITACGSKSSSDDLVPNESPQEPAYYVAKYEALAKPHLGADFKVTTDIQLVASVSGGVGGCIAALNQIQLQQSYWTGLNGVERKEVLYHELAHCSQYRPHLENAHSLMTGGLLPTWQDFQANEDAYETELFAVQETCGVGDALACRTAK